MQTALMEAQSKARLAYAMRRLLHNLRNWVLVYPMRYDDKMPEHDVVWDPGDSGEGPEQVILDAIKEAPELWAHALPKECCIVRRDELKNILGPVASDAIKAMAMNGAATVAAEAARARHEREDLERRLSRAGASD